MALTLNTTYVDGIDPVYNPITYAVTSNNSTYLNYKYVFNLYTGQTATAPTISTIKLNPRPDGTAYYNPARVLESIVSADLLLANITADTISNHSFKAYNIGFNEYFSGVRFSDTFFSTGITKFNIIGYNPFQVGDSIIVAQDGPAYDISGDTVSYDGTYVIYALDGGMPVVNTPFISTGVNPGYITYQDKRTFLLTGTTYSANTFNGILGYELVPTWNSTAYKVANSIQPTTKLFLTNQPRSGVNVKNITDRGTLSYLIYDTNFDYVPITVRYTVNTNSGNTNHDVVLTPDSGTTNNIWHIPSGPWNINQFLGGQVITSNVNYYTIELRATILGGRLTEQLKYVVDQRCSKYETVRLQFLNRLGTWDYINFDMISRTNIDVTRKYYKRNLPVGYQVGDREKTAIDIDGNYTYIVTSNWLNNDQSNWIEELFTSQNVNIINSDGSSLPVNIKENSIEILKTINNKMISYTFACESAYSINSQRG